MSKGPIVIIHFQPLEYYPPIMNTLQYFAGRLTDQQKIYVFTTQHTNNLNAFPSPHKRIFIKRFPGILKSDASWKRMLKYIWFHGLSFLLLVLKKPARVLYYETLSSLPAVLYKKLRNGVELLVHYHEYTTPQQYQNGMMLSRKFHQQEKEIYSRVAWISHTNAERMRLFLMDNEGIQIPNTRILPNYPPRKWLGGQSQSQVGRSVKLVYAGALSLQTMYTKEIFQWVHQQNGKVTLDLYSYNMQADIQGYIAEIDSPYIRVHAGVDYFSLPAILKNYDIGIIIYKGTTANYIHNAPNKLFEYIACGLDTWYPAVMTGCKPYMRTNVYPKVIPIEFEQLHSLDYQSLTDRTGLNYQPSEYFADTVLESLSDMLLGHSMQMPPMSA